ncbi:proton-associated sugar transporter a [Plakobranchus ocellatus]|uniref:Proton-associated sugar transporter a n=1 Tax=Plakobranchus ocellatus TaxID=259542 RepID=A0AAV3Z0B2_9GAST|nr:proton-associated sugar transporter a [Plakobranchus ocellatus]
MDVGILRALQTVRTNPYINYVGLGLAGLVSQKDQHDPVTGEPLRKTKLQLVRISAAVCGIELCYAAETAFVSPILLKLGVPTTLMTMVWCLSPLLGFFLVPIMGSLSDRCRSRIGRRRPFIILMAMGIVLGLALVPNGESLGRLLGDSGNITKLDHPNLVSQKENRMSAKEDIQLRVTDLTSGKPNWDDGRKQKKTKEYLPLAADRAGIDKDLKMHRQKNNSLIALYKAVYHNGSYTENVKAKNNLQKSTAIQSSSPLSFTIPSHGVRGIILTILGVAMLDFNCDACQSPSRAYLLDVSVPGDHQTGLTTFTVMAGLGGTVGYIMGGIDWNATSFGEALGGHIRVVFTIVLVCFIVCILSTLTSFRETPLDELDIKNEVDGNKIKKKKDKKKYRRFTNEDSLSEEDDIKENSGEAMRKGRQEKNVIFYGSMSGDKHSKLGNTIDIQKQWLAPETRNGSALNGNCQKIPAEQNECWNVSNGRFQTSSSGLTTKQLGECVQKKADGNELEQSFQQYGQVWSYTENVEEISPYTKNACNIMSLSRDVDLPVEVDDIKLLDVSTDVTLRTYLQSIVHMPSSLWVLCATNLFCWMSLLCYSLYFTDFVGQSVFGGDPAAPVGSDLHNYYDAGVRLGSWGMSLYSLSCSCYSLIIEKLVKKFRAKPVYVYGQLTYSVGMIALSLARTKWAVLLFSPTAGIMYATLFTMPYMLVAHYHTRGLFSQSNNAGGLDDLNAPPPQVRGLGTDVAIVSSMVFMAQFLLSVAMGTIMAAVGSTVTVLVASSVLSFCGALTALRVTYLDL